jgi:hypothetical protein
VLGGGSFFYDVSAYVQEIGVQRGKSRALDRYNSGQARVTFNNRNRYFDPTYTASPFYGQIVPRRDVRIWANGEIVYVGTTDDWDLNYAPNGDSVAVLSAYDGFAFLAQQTLTAATNPVELSGARVNRILDDPGVAWPSGARSVSAGDETLQGDTVELGANALEYLQTIESTEPGELFIGKSGNLTFQARNAVAPSSAAVVLSDDATGVRYSSVRVVYGSELLFTQTELQRRNSSVTIQTNDLDAQSNYGLFVYHYLHRIFFLHLFPPLTNYLIHLIPHLTRSYRVCDGATLRNSMQPYLLLSTTTTYQQVIQTPLCSP